MLRSRYRGGFVTLVIRSYGQRSELMGNFSRELGSHRIEFERGGDTLVISFDNAGAPHVEPRDRRGWGHKFFTEEGHSTLGVIAHESDWFRNEAIRSELRRLEQVGFFASFAHVVMTGSSMGGFAATAFASLVPGCTVISFNPQSTLNASLVPWETGHANGRRKDWTGSFMDGAVESRQAAKVYLFYDPFHQDDRRHAERYTADNVVRMRCPFLGHGLPVAFVELGILKTVMRQAIAGRLTEEAFRPMLAGRREIQRYYKTLVTMLATERHRHMGLRVANLAASRFPDDIWFKQRRALYLAAAGRLETANDILLGLDRERRRRKSKRGK